MTRSMTSRAMLIAVIVCSAVSLPLPLRAHSAATLATDAPSVHDMSAGQVLEMIAEEISASLPLQIDAETQLTSVAIVDGSLVYGYESMVSLEETQLLVEQKRSLIEILTCRNPLHGTLLLDGRRVRYRYAVEGDVVAEVSVSLKACDLVPDRDGGPQDV